MPSKKTLVMGASGNPARYSNLAILRLQDAGHNVVAIGKRRENIAGIAVETEGIAWQDIDTVTIYLNPGNLEGWRNYILSLKPKRIIFNPGAEHPEFAREAGRLGIAVMDACTLVLLSTGQY